MGEQLPHLLRRLKMWRQSCGENLLVTRGSLVAQTPTMGCRISLLHWGHREKRPAVHFHCCSVEPLCFVDPTCRPSPVVASRSRFFTFNKTTWRLASSHLRRTKARTSKTWSPSRLREDPSQRRHERRTGSGQHVIGSENSPLKPSASLRHRHAEGRPTPPLVLSAPRHF